MTASLRSIVQAVCLPFRCCQSLIPCHQARSPFARAGIASARFSSTALKQSTLKERLTELIPAEIEKVCLLCDGASVGLN